MDCKEARMHSKSYLLHELPEEIMGPYIDHIQNCTECKDELLTDYSITTALKQLSANEDFYDNYYLQLENKLKRSETYVKKRKQKFVMKTIGAAIMFCIIGCFITTRKEPVYYRFLPENTRKESLAINFYGVPKASDPIRNTILEYNSQVIDKIRQEADANKGE